MKLIVYTALFADENLPLTDVGEFHPFSHEKGDVRYVAFTNRRDLKSDFWEITYLDSLYKSTRLMSRRIKWRPAEYLTDFTHTLWMDSQCYFEYEPKAVVTHYLQDKFHTAIHHHTDLKSIYVEGMVSSYVYRTDKPEIVNRQLEEYFKEGMPYEYDHYETGILIRKNTKQALKFSERVAKEVESKSIRDQICVPYTVWKFREGGDNGIHTIQESFTSHKGQLPLPKSKIFFTWPKPSERLRENLEQR